MYHVLTIARYIIWYCKRHGFSISNLKLQKILYFVQANFLVNRGIPCFSENIEAWDFGPVVPEVYHEFKIFGNADIPEYVCQGAETTILINDRMLIDEMIDQCAPFSASTLVEITHNQAPWNDAYEKYHNNIISQASLRAFFERV